MKLLANLLRCSIIFAAINMMHASAANNAEVGRNYIINLNTDCYPKYFAYSGSALNPMSVVTAQVAVTGVSKETTYKSFYFAPFQCVGSRQSSPMRLSPNEDVEIRCKAFSGQFAPQMSYAAAGAIVRIALDLQLNHVVLSGVRVQDQNFEMIVSSLERYGFHLKGDDSGESFQRADVVLRVQSASGHQTATLLYSS